MKPTELIASIQSHLNGELTDAAVQVGGTSERPTPMIEVADATISERHEHNSRYVGSTVTDGVEQSRDYRVSYDCQISFEIRHDDTVKASQLRDSLRLELSKLNENPSDLGENVFGVKLDGGGQINYQYIEPTETTMNQDAVFSASRFCSKDIEELENEVIKDFAVNMTNIN